MEVSRATRTVALFLELGILYSGFQKKLENGTSGFATTRPFSKDQLLSLALV